MSDHDHFIAAARLEGVPSAFAATRDGMDAFLRDRGLRRSTPEDTAQSLMAGALASAALEGDDEITRQASIRLSSELLGLLPTWQRTPVQAIARMHALAAAGSVAEADLGRPVNPAGVARLNDLAHALSEPTEAPGLVVAALVHAEIAGAGAFASHNGVVARAAERLVLVSRGIDPASVTVPEAGHAAEPAAYRSAMTAFQHDGIAQWLLYAAQAFLRGAEASPLARRA